MTMTCKINKLEKPGGQLIIFQTLFGRSATFYGHFRADTVTSEWSTHIPSSLFTKKFFFNTSFEELFARSDQQGFLERAAQMSTLNIHWMAGSCGWLLLRQIIRQVIYSLKNLSSSLLHVFIFSKGANIQPATLIKNELLRKYISSRFLTTSAEQPISRTTVRLPLSNILF